MTEEEYGAALRQHELDDGHKKRLPMNAKLGGATSESRQRRAATAELIRPMAEKGMCQSHIAAALGKADCTVKDIARRYGIKIKKGAK